MVREVGIFTCLLTTGDNVQIRVPNSQIFGATIKNFSASETRRIDMVMGVGYDDDLGVAIRTIQDVLARIDQTGAARPRFGVLKLGTGNAVADFLGALKKDATEVLTGLSGNLLEQIGKFKFDANGNGAHSAN